MNKIFYWLSCLLLLSSCAEQYNIAGNASVSFLDGRMLYLRVSPDGIQENCVDSCEVVHGRFSFIGDIDSVVMAQLYMDNESMMPLVIENGKLTVQVDNIGQRVMGSPLNDRLYGYQQKKSRLENEMWEVQQKAIRMVRAGSTPEDVSKKLSPKAEKLNKEIEELETDFIMDNYDNVLGPGFFIQLCNQYPYPVMTEQITRIVKKAPSSFLNHPFVRHYVRAAEDNMQRMNLPQ